MDFRELNLEELEERALDGEPDAIRELARRYSEGDGVGQNIDIANRLKGQLGEEEIPPAAEREEEPDEAPADAGSWNEQYNAMRTKVIAVLRNEAINGDPAALIVLAENYLESVNRSEVNEGLKLLDDAENILRSNLAQDRSSFTKEALVHLFIHRGKKLEEIYQRTGEEYLPQMIFDAYSNANELDPAQVEGLIHCYKEGIGTGRDIYKAKGYEAQYALNGGIEERFNVGIDAYYNAETMRATEWFQNALLAENADDHAGLKCFMRVLLGRMHSTDENGQAIDEGQELRELFDMAQTQYDAEAAWCVAQLMDNSDVQLRYYELGAGGSPDKYAKACAQQAEQIRIEIEQAELRARKEEEQRRLEEAQRKQEEEKRAALEKEMQELEARRKEEERYEQSQNAFGFNDKYVGGSEKSSDLEGALARFDFPTTWIVIALILFWPLGVFMGMTTTRWTLKGKTILAIIIGLFIILGLMVSALPS